MARRVTRKMLKENEFVTGFDHATHWVQARWRPLAAAIGAVAVALVGWWGINTLVSSRSQDASFLLHRAVAALEGAGGAPGSPDAAEPLLREVVDRYGRSDEADAARLFLARIALGRGDTESARSALRELAERQRGSSIGQLAALDLVHLRVAAGQSAEVAGELQAMVTAADPQLPRDTALYELAMILLSEERVDEAKAQLAKLVEEFPESPYRFPAQQRLSELG